MSRRLLTAIIGSMFVDLALIIVFAAFGRNEHAEGGGITETLRIAGPFLVGWIFGAIAVRLYRRPLHPAAAGRAWAVALPLGFALRSATGRGLELGFMLVALAVLAFFLLSWRLLWWFLRARTRTAQTA